MSCEHITFGLDNYIEHTDMVLSATPAPVTDLDWLRNDDPAQVAKWTNLDGDVVIEGVYSGQIMVDHFAIPGSNLNPDACVQVELFSNATDTAPVFDTGLSQVGEILPLGVWRAGIDPFGGSDNEPLNSMQAFMLDSVTLVQRFRMTIKHGFAYEPPPPTEPQPVITTNTVSDGIFRQDNSGVLSVEAESGVVTTVELDTWQSVADAAASGGTALYKNGNDFYWNPNEGPRVNVEFTASQSGVHDVWLRLRSIDGNSLYCVFDGHSQYLINPGAPFGGAWAWFKARTITTVAEQRHNISVNARDHFIYYDKMVIQPAGTAAPTGTGPAESGTGTTTETTATLNGESTVTSITSTDSVQLRMLIMGNSLKLENNISLGSVISFLTPTNHRLSHTGRAITARQQHLSRRMTLPLNLMPESDRLNLWLLEVTKAGRSFLVSAYPGHSDWFSGNYMFLGKFERVLEYQHHEHSYHKTQLVIIEA